MSKQKNRRFYPAQPPKQPAVSRTLIFCKPYKVLSSFTDLEGRSTVGDFVDVPDVYAAGRLDYDSEGLLLLTSDGKLAHRITHPRYKLPKVYLVQVERIPDEAALNQLRAGVLVQGQLTRSAQVERFESEPEVFPRSEPIRYRQQVPTDWLKIVIAEGRKRQVRRMTAAVDHPTLRLIRLAIGPIELGDLQPGQWRDLTKFELDKLQTHLKMTA
ncbi:MAG: pseudouridine synthase [Anaerolineaceae bacterium]|nr:pseudouridine synthase [Anaerolineaceae bacterium]MCB9100886.1 pseudouridine synthase [Anaerolineales bacterium]